MPEQFKINPLTGKLDLVSDLTETIALTDLSDVTITSPADNELLAFDSGTGEWINQTPTEAGLDAIYVNLSGDTMTGNLGIGMSATFPLDVLGIGRFSTTVFANNARVNSIDDNASTANAGINFGGASKFINFETDATERMRIISDGKVGIGTAVPEELLNVFGTTVAIMAEGDGVTKAGFKIKTNNVLRWDINSPSAQTRLAFVDGSGNEVLTLEQGGAVGIGISSEIDGLLHVHSGSAGIVTARGAGDELVIENSTNAGMSILTPDTSTGSIIFGSPTDPLGADLKWNHDNNVFIIGSRKATAILRLVSGNGTTALDIDGNQNFDFQAGNLTTTGTVTLAGLVATANLDIGTFELRANTFESDVATGIAPFTVASTTVVANLNATQWNGLTNSITLGATGDLYFRDSAGNVVNLGVGSNGQQLQSNGTIPGWVTPVSPTTPSWATVLTAGSTSGGTDVTISTTDELKGTKHSIILSNDAGGTVSAVASLNVKAGEVLMTTTKGLTMIRAGSIVGISVNYDVTAITSTPELSIDVLKNGIIEWINSISSTVANDKEEQFTQARATDTFVAGDTIIVQFNDVGLGTDATMDDIIVMLEFYYDT